VRRRAGRPAEAAPGRARAEHGTAVWHSDPAARHAAPAAEWGQTEVPVGEGERRGRAPALGAGGVVSSAVMLFATEDLAARIERAEAGMVADAARQVARRLPAGAAFIEPIAGGVAIFTEHGSPLTKVAGLGFAGPLDEDELGAIEAAYAVRGCPLRVEISTLADPSIGALLTARGYTLAGFENVLGRALPAEAPARSDGALTIERSGADRIDTWLDVIVTGFATPDTRGVPSDESFPRDVLDRIMRDFAQTDGMATYLATLDGELAGGASMRTSEGVALLCGAATLPAHRRRGVQAALLARRLADAAQAGCDLAAVTTQPGSTSQQNVQRKGFELLYARAVLVRQASG